jgi:hypothetical protein
MDTLLTAMNQQPDSKGIRRTKHVIIRNTYRMLIDTTMATFFHWIPKESGLFLAKDMSFTLHQQLPDNTLMEAEFLFRALDKPDDVAKVLSLEVTTAWINEARDIPKSIFDAIQGRVGRYPPPSYDTPVTFHGVIADTNPPDVDHWIPDTFEPHRMDDGSYYSPPDNHKLFHMPSGVSPQAENIEHLPPNYYTNLMAGKSKEWVDVYIHGNYGFVADGRPVFPEFNTNLHYAPSLNYEVDHRLPLYIGIDFGRTPAAAFGQITPNGTLILFDEVCTDNMGAVQFGKLLYQKLNTYPYKDFPPHLLEVYGDPAGEQQTQVDDTTPFLALQAQGIYAVPTFTNDFTIRRESLASFMTTLNLNSKPALQVTGGAPTLYKSLAGGYEYKRLQVTGDSKYHDKPDKGRFSHIGDGAMYLCVGAVGDTRVFGNAYSSKKLDYSKTIRAIR